MLCTCLKISDLKLKQKVIFLQSLHKKKQRASNTLACVFVKKQCYFFEVMAVRNIMVLYIGHFKKLRTRSALLVQFNSYNFFNFSLYFSYSYFVIFSY